MRAAIVPLLLLLALALAGCSADDGGDPGADGGNGSGGADGDTEVEVDDDYFEPEDVTIAAGSELHFVVEDSAEHPHTITIHKSTDPADTRRLNITVRAGDDARFVFEEAGTYHVWCEFHGSMTGGMHMLVTAE